MAITENLWGGRKAALKINMKPCRDNLAVINILLECCRFTQSRPHLRVGGYGRGFSEECLICKMQTPPGPPAPTTNPALQSGGSTSEPSTPPQVWSPMAPGTLFPPCRLLLTWVFSSSVQGPSRNSGWLFSSLLRCLQSHGARGSPAALDNSGPLARRPCRWTT